jgi:carboxyl-terminal processing protease
MKISKKIIYSVVLVVLLAGSFGLGTWFGIANFSYHVEQPDTVDFSLFWDAYNKLNENFINPDKIDNQKIIYGAIKGMAESVGDPYTSFFDPTQAQKFQQDLAGSFSGIGVEIAVRKGLLTIVAPLKDTPGERAGLRSGDIIAKINGKDTSDMTGDDAVSLIRGQKDTEVSLTIFRDEWDTTKDFKIIRDTINVPTMAWSLKDGDVAYVQIFQFDDNLTSEFKKAALQILQSPAKKIVLDLRGNPGGYLGVAQDVAGWFIKEGQTVTIEDFKQGREQQIYKAEGGAELSEYPVVVLIDQGSASASEILAGALRDNRNVKLVGEKSFGKGSVQEAISLPGGSFLKITIAKWLTPKGASISEVGLEPDVKVEITDKDIEQKKDPQFEKALEIIKNLK